VSKVQEQPNRQSTTVVLRECSGARGRYRQIPRSAAGSASALQHERCTDTYSRIRLPELVPLVEPPIVAQAQAAFPDTPASQAVVLRWHLRGLNLELALRKAALSAEIEARKHSRDYLG
jgi:hypothetical protein